MTRVFESLSFLLPQAESEKTTAKIMIKAIARLNFISIPPILFSIYMFLLAQ